MKQFKEPIIQHMDLQLQFKLKILIVFSKLLMLFNAEQYMLMRMMYSMQVFSSLFFFLKFLYIIILLKEYHLEVHINFKIYYKNIFNINFHRVQIVWIWKRLRRRFFLLF